MTNKRSDISLRKQQKYQPLTDDIGEPPNWNDLTNKDKLKLFNGWNIITIIADIFLLTGSFFLALNVKANNKKAELFIGLGAMLTWFSLLKFYQNKKGFNTIANTLENSFEI